MILQSPNVTILINFQLNLKLSEPVYNIFVLRFRLKNQQFSVALPTP